MTVTKETVPVEGVISGQGLERTCRLRAVRRQTYADESTKPLCVSYSRCDIEDTDDFPDGEYELSFDGCRIRVIKKTGRYFPA
jgi:hypothetical protein